MSDAGFFDLAAPLLGRIDVVLAIALPALARVLLYAVLAAWLGMWLYARLSPQRRLQALRRRLRASQQRMLDDDIAFGELLRRSGHSLRLGGAQVWMTLWPSLLVAVPLLFLLSWMSNRFDSVHPIPGTIVAVCVEPLAAAANLHARGLEWSKGVDNAGCRPVAWPRSDAGAALVANGVVLIELPLAEPISVIHQRRWWNRAFGNPLGYLPTGGEVDVIRFQLPALQILPFGPDWLRGWIAPFLLVMTVLSLWLRWRWKLV